MTGVVDSLGSDWTLAPTDKLDYQMDWLGNGWLPTGDTISNSAWTAVAIGGLASAPTLSGSAYTANDTTIWFTGGDEGADYVLYNQITTAAGRKVTRSIKIRVRGTQV